MDLVERGEVSQSVRFGHTIPTFWNAVTLPHKALIAGMFRNSTGEPYTTGPESRLRVFEDALRNLGNQPFVQWRYVHELRPPQLMSHGAISIVVDALGHAAEYIVKRARTRRKSSDGESHAD